MPIQQMHAHNTVLMGAETREEKTDKGRQAGERKHTYSPPSTGDIHTCPPPHPIDSQWGIL